MDHLVSTTTAREISGDRGRLSHTHILYSIRGLGEEMRDDSVAADALRTFIVDRMLGLV